MEEETSFDTIKLDPHRHIQLARVFDDYDNVWVNICVFRRLIARNQKVIPQGAEIIRVGKRFKLSELCIYLSDDAIEALNRLNQVARL